MKKIIILFLFIISFASCTNNEKAKKTENLIEKSKFITVLTELHIADGIIKTKGLKRTIKKGDSNTYYNHIFKKYSISRADFETTVEFYAKHTDEYKIIYDSVTANLTNIEKKLGKNAVTGKKNKVSKNDIWNKKRKWSLPKDGKKNPIYFNIPAKKHGKYILSANIRFFKDDKTINPRLTILAKYTDNTQDANSNGTIIKDGKFSSYSTFIITDKKKKLKSISGWLLDHSKGTKTKHIDAKNIKLLYYKNVLHK